MIQRRCIDDIFSKKGDKSVVLGYAQLKINVLSDVFLGV